MRSWFLLLAILYSKTCLAQDLFQVHLYDSENGLIDNSVRSITQDSRGFMWFSTPDGLSRFDGINFKNYLTNRVSPFSFNLVLHLTEIRSGHLALVNESRSLSVLDTYTDQFYHPVDFINKSVLGIHKIAAERYVINANDSCFVANQYLKIIDTLKLPSHAHDELVFEDRLTKETHLVGTKTKPSEWQLFNTRTKEFQKLNLELDEPSPNHLVFNFYDSLQQWLYFGNYFSGIYRYSIEGVLLKKWPCYGYQGVSPINDSTLLIGLSDDYGGALILNLKNDALTPLIINNKSQYKSHESYTDREGNHWLGTDEGVASIRMNNQPIKNWDTFQEEPDPSVFPLGMIKGSDQNLYLSIFGRPTFYKFDNKNEKWNLISRDLIAGSWCVNNVGDDIIFTGGRTMRFTTFSPRNKTYQYSSDFLRKYFPKSDVLILAFQHSNGDRWYSANNGGGFVRISADDGLLHHYTKDGDRGHFRWSYYASYAEDHAGNLWFGVNKTEILLHWDKQTDRFSEVSFDTVPGTVGGHFQAINQILLGKDNNLWIGFEGTGLVKYNFVNNRSVHYSVIDGLASNYIYSMTFDGKDRLWIGTPKGLSCLFENENRIQNFTKEDGLFDAYLKDRFIYYDDATNKLWVGATTSVMRFDPDKLIETTSPKINVYVDEVYINGIRSGYDTVKILHLNHKENNIQFRCAAVNIEGKSLQFSYQLIGYDPKWIDNLSRNISFANLESGTYSFNVRVNYNGDTSHYFTAEPFVFVIVTPWFKTWWFRLVAFTGGLFLNIFLVRLYYARKNEKQRLILEKQQAVEKERTRIATDMHDDFGSSLSRIKFISERIKLKSDGESSLLSDLNKISTYSDEMAEKINEIVWALNERYDTLEDLVSYSRAYAAEYLTQHKIELNFEADSLTNKYLNGEVRRNIFLILKEALHNTVKHSGANQVNILIRQNQNLCITFSDNGKGLDIQNVRPFANGLNNMRKRMTDIGGIFEIEDSNGVSIQLSVRI